MCRRESGLVRIESTTRAIWSICRPSGRRPGPPLVPVDRAELAVGVGPLVPDADAALLQPAHVGRALQEPDQLTDHRLQVQLLGGHRRKAVGEVEAHLVAEDAQRAGAGAVVLGAPCVRTVSRQIQVLPHPTNVSSRRRCRSARRGPASVKIWTYEARPWNTTRPRRSSRPSPAHLEQGVREQACRQSGALSCDGDHRRAAGRGVRGSRSTG